MTSTPSPNPLRKALADLLGAIDAGGMRDAMNQWLAVKRARSALAANDAAGGGTASEARAPDNRVIVRLTICGDSTGWQEKTCATSFAVLLPHSLDRFRQHRLIVGEAAKAISDYMADECLNALYPLPPAPAGADEKEDGR